MLSFRSTTVVVLWSGVLFGAAIPASWQCEVHEDAKLTARRRGGLACDAQDIPTVSA